MGLPCDRTPAFLVYGVPLSNHGYDSCHISPCWQAVWRGAYSHILCKIASLIIKDEGSPWDCNMCSKQLFPLMIKDLLVKAPPVVFAELQLLATSEREWLLARDAIT